MRSLLTLVLVSTLLAGCASTTPATPTQSSTPSSSTPASSTPTSTTPATPQDFDIHIKGFAFNPASYPEELGGTVSWINDDAVAHTVTADDGSFDSGPLAPGQSFTHAFPVAGTVAYHCKIHATMKGAIVVGNATTPPTSPAQNATTTVHIVDFAFSGNITVPAGTTVTWINDGTRTHTATSDDNATFTSGNLAPGQSFSFTFATPGTYTYHCAIHARMKASITVT